MNDYGEFDKELLEISGGIKSGYLFFINNAGKFTALITLCIAAVLIFADIGLADPKSAAFTTTLSAMLTASYVIYFSLEDSGERLGECSEEYKDAISKYKSIRQRIDAHNISALRNFCTRYALGELSFRRECYITESGYTPEEYSAYKRGEHVKLRDRRVFMRAERMSAVKLTPQLLLSGAAVSAKSELENPEKKKILSSFLNLLPSTLCMIFTVSVILTAKGDLTPSVIVEGLIKLSALPIIGFRGYTAGYSFVKNKKVLWVQTKTRLLETFIREEEEKIGKAP